MYLEKGKDGTQPPKTAQILSQGLLIANPACINLRIYQTQFLELSDAL